MNKPDSDSSLVDQLCYYKRRTEELELSEQRYRSIFTSMEPASCLDEIVYENGKAVNYRILEINPSFERILGIPRSKAVGSLATDVYNTNQLPFFETYVRVAETGKAENFEGFFEPAGKHLNISVSSSEPGKFSNVVTDISESKKIEEQLRQSQKMEAVGILAGGIAHDFNNILQAILGYSQLLSESIPAGSEHHIELNEIIKCGERAAKLTRQLLAFSRKQIIQPKVVNLNEIVDNMQSMLKRVIGEHINLNWFPGFKLGKISADVSMMEQVLANLCINSRDAMPDGGTLTIETQNVVFDKEYCKSHTWARIGRYVLLSITDTGHGISKEALPHVFEPFFTTKGKGRGTGLGLSTVYGIIRQHEGMINVYSEMDTGTTFKLYYPICERQAKEIDNLIETPIAAGNETILLAEDDDSVRSLAVLVLQQAGYTVLPASDGIEAVKKFNENRKSIDLLILDVVMPNLGGYEVLKKVLEKSPGTPALFCSGYSENSIHNKFVLKEGIRLIEKPYTSRQLLEAVRKTLDKV